MLVLVLLFALMANAEPLPNCSGSTKDNIFHCNCAATTSSASDLAEILSLVKELKHKVDNLEQGVGETNARLENIEKFIGKIPTSPSGGQDWCQGLDCVNGGKCAGLNTCVCPSPYGGKTCERYRLGTKQNPAPNAVAILEAGESVGSGIYWIQPPGESSPAMTYCDMQFRGGGWMLASYGYVANVATADGNKAIPNMNHPHGYTWLPNSRSSSSGVINLEHGASLLANAATGMIMAAGHNPDIGGIDQYSYVYFIDITNKPFNISFANHNRYHGASGGGGIGQMHLTEFNVTALRGETGTYTRYTLAESLGVTWADSYPTGYGLFGKKERFPPGFAKGPFFPSVHSGDGRGAGGQGVVQAFPPDVTSGHPQYVHKGWYTLSGTGQIGQTSIWFK